MSYILDALKKSEAERNRGSLPTLLTIPSAGLFKSNAAIWALLGALIINAALFATWLYWPTQPDLPQQTASIAAAAAPAPTPRADAPTPSIAAPVLETRAAADIQDGARSSTLEPPAAQFAFSTHVYADDPTLRAVTLNGRRFVEGDTISAGVQLKQITETGVVLDIDGRSVAMDVLQDWR